MNRSLIFSIGRKYLGLFLIVGSLVLIASTNTPSSTPPMPQTAPLVTFLHPKQVLGATVMSPRDTHPTDVSSTTYIPSSAAATPRTAPTTTNTDSSPTPSNPPKTDPNASATPPPANTYTPPADNDPQMPSDPLPNYGCNSCRPKPGSHIMCDQPLMCLY